METDNVVTLPAPSGPPPASTFQQTPTSAPQPATRQRRLARAAAAAIYDAFETYQSEFTAITRRARERFEKRQWHAWQHDGAERLDLYGKITDSLVSGLQVLLETETTNHDLWQATRKNYAQMITHRADVELAETFFNSATRRVFDTVGIDPSLEFAWFGAEHLPSGDEAKLFRLYVKIDSLEKMLEAILRDYAFAAPYSDVAGDARLAAEQMRSQLRSSWVTDTFDCVHMLKSVFYRNKGAYLIGRVRKRNRILPLVLPLVHDENGIRLDALLLSENEASRIFSFTHSYFHVDVETPVELVAFLKSILPLKPIAELYTAIGYNKHGKTALYRALYRHLGNSTDRFEIAPGAKGMVMTVFALPCMMWSSK